LKTGKFGVVLIVFVFSLYQKKRDAIFVFLNIFTAKIATWWVIILAAINKLACNLKNLNLEVKITTITPVLAIVVYLVHLT
jgi:hypothetical protein